jgi:hypothetical protein
MDDALDRPADTPEDDEPMGGDSPCWAHLLDEDGRMPEPAQPTSEPRTPAP